MKVSIILVHYNKIKVLDDCIKSIYASKPNSSFEIIVVDNDEVKTIEPSLMKHFPKIKYIKGYGNLGYGKATNLGVKNAIGEYIFNLNPDTIVEKGVVDKLIDFIQKNKKVGAVAPTLYDKNGKNYPLQGTRKLTPLRGIFALSFLNKYFPGNPISKSFWLLNADRSQPLEADTIPFTIFMMRKDLFLKMGGFDENYFLYFEEADFCNRLKAESYKLFILPAARAMHLWGANTPKSEKINKILLQSRFYYFKKHFGILNALIVEFFARINKWSLMLIAILALGTFLRFYRLPQNMIFNGEMGYDYMTIRTFVENHQIPLMGPRTSHEWFFIGPLFYWIFGILLPLFNYNVVVGAYFFATVGVLSILVCYWTVKSLFGQKAAVISSFMLSFSPLWVKLTHDARFNAMTAILFFPFYYFLVKSIKDKGKSFFILGVTLGVMFSFFPSPILLLPGAVVAIFIYRQKIDKKYLIPGVFGFIIPNIPYLIYNATHKFEILGNLFAWIPYRILGFFGLYPKNTVTPHILQTNISGLYTFFQQTYLHDNNILIFVLTLAVIIYAIVRMRKNVPLTVLMIIFGTSYLGLFLHGAPPQHYYLVIFPVPIILLSLFLEKISKRFLWATIVILGYLLIVNVKFFFSERWFNVNSVRMSDDLTYVPFSLQEKVAGYISNDTGSRSFFLARVGLLDYFGENFSLNYQYLLRNMGKKPDKSALLRYTIYEDTSNLPANEKIFWVENIAVSKNE